ncbi:MAG: hypothetical protein INR69_16570 [Mucilaginibacter polytrichastri]|nr:hypothetical protein [Mucilaginibacter polytrichastri]
MIAALTGDIVGSTQLERADAEALIEYLKKELAALFGEDTAVFRGDSFQAVEKNVQSALPKAIMLRAKLKTWLDGRGWPSGDVRIAIGYGESGTIARQISESNGEAFRLSGRALDAMGDELLALACADAGKNTTLQVLASLLDAVMQGWTAPQAEVAAWLLNGSTQTEIAAALGISQPAVHKRAQRTRWAQIGNAIRYIHNLINE